MNREAHISTIIALENWLSENCYSMNGYSINGNLIYEGFGLENNGGLYQWFYIERGEKNTLAYFSNEEEAVQFALKQIKDDEHAKRNYLGRYNTKDVEKVLSELKKRGVEYWTDMIPSNRIYDQQTRVFVIGCGIKKER